MKKQNRQNIDEYQQNIIRTTSNVTNIKIKAKKSNAYKKPQHCLKNLSWIPWNLSFRYIHCTGQFTPKMKANAKPRLLPSLVWIDSGIVVSQHHLEHFFHEIKCNRIYVVLERWMVQQESMVGETSLVQSTQRVCFVKVNLHQVWFSSNRNESSTPRSRQIGTVLTCTQ